MKLFLIKVWGEGLRWGQCMDLPKLSTQTSPQTGREVLQSL